MSNNPNNYRDNKLSDSCKFSMKNNFTCILKEFIFKNVKNKAISSKFQAILQSQEKKKTANTKT